jgi:hypothetical protein
MSVAYVTIPEVSLPPIYLAKPECHEPLEHVQVKYLKR